MSHKALAIESLEIMRSLWEGDYTTIAGMVLAKLGHIPTEPGEVVEVHLLGMVLHATRDEHPQPGLRRHQAGRFEQHEGAAGRIQRMRGGETRFLRLEAVGPVISGMGDSSDGAKLERAIASAGGIDYIESQSAMGMSTVTAHLRLNYDPLKAMTEISAKVNQVRGDLPPEAEVPAIRIEPGNFLFRVSHKPGA